MLRIDEPDGCEIRYRPGALDAERAAALEIVEEKAVFARDPVKERLLEIGEMLRRAAARGQ